MWALLLALVCSLTAHPASAQPTPPQAGAFIVLGDSVSDNGNYFSTRGLGNNTYPLARANINGTRHNLYWNGRFTNALGVWSDHLAREVRRIVISNFAFGGATLCPTSNYVIPTPLLRRVPDVGQQVRFFYNKLNLNSRYNATIRSRYAGPTLNATSAPVFYRSLAQCLNSSARALLDNGVTALVIATVPPLDLTPFALSLGISRARTPVLAAINEGYKQVVTQLQSAYPRAKVILWDVNAVMTNIVTNSTRLGFRFNNTRSCLTVTPAYSPFLGTLPQAVCTNATEYVFWDNNHYSSRAHRLVADSFIRTMLNASVGLDRNDLVRPQGFRRRLRMATGGTA